MQAQILAVVMYITIAVNLFAGAFISATPADHPLPWWVLASYAGFNTISSALKSDGLHIPSSIVASAAKASAWIVGGLVALNILVACTTGSLQGSIAGLEVGLASAETGASYYTNLPSCTTPPTVSPCSDPATVSKIRQSDNDAYAAIKQAQKTAAAGGTVDVAALTALLTGFQTAVAQLPKPPAKGQ